MTGTVIFIAIIAIVVLVQQLNDDFPPWQS